MLAARGLHVVLVDRDPEPLEATRKAIADATGVEVRAVPLDLADADLAQKLRDATAGLEVGLAVYNAAASPLGPFLEQPLPSLLEVVDVNCRGPLVVARVLGAKMAERERGGIVVVSSLAGGQGQGWLAAYAASKAFGGVLAEGLWDELRARGVDVLAVRPGAIRTPGYERAAPRRPPRFAPRVMKPEDVVRETLAALGRAPSVVPGRGNRVAAWILARLLPRRVAIQTMGRTARALRRSSP